MMAQNSITKITTGGLFRPDEPDMVFDVQMKYDPSDPYAVRLIFGPDEVEWVLGRELLSGGLFAETGEGDVRVWPTQGRTPTVSVALAPGDAVTIINIDRQDVVSFISKTYKMVPAGTEYQYLPSDIPADWWIKTISSPNERFAELCGHENDVPGKEVWHSTTMMENDDNEVAIVRLTHNIEQLTTADINHIGFMIRDLESTPGNDVGWLRAEFGDFLADEMLELVGEHVSIITHFDALKDTALKHGLLFALQKSYDGVEAVVGYVFMSRHQGDVEAALKANLDKYVTWREGSLFKAHIEVYDSATNNMKRSSVERLVVRKNYMPESVVASAVSGFDSYHITMTSGSELH